MAAQDIPTLTSLPQYTLDYLRHRAFADARMRVEDLPPAQQRSVLAGYGVIALLLGVALLVELLGTHLPSISFGSPTDGHRLPSIVILVSALSLALGWAYLLTGALDSGRRVFLPIVGLLGFQLLLLLPWNAEALIGLCVVPLGVLVGLYLAFGRTPFWQAAAPYKMLLAALSMLLYLGLFWQQNSIVGQSGWLSISFLLIQLLLVFFWITAGLAVVDSAVAVACHVMIWLRALFPEPFLRALATFLILTRPAISILSVVVIMALRGLNVEQGSTLLSVRVLFLDGMLTAPFGVLLGLLALLGQWTTRNVLTVLALTFVSPVATLGLLLALQGSNINDWFGMLEVSSMEDVVGMTATRGGFIPPLVLFVGVTALTWLSRGVAFASMGDKVMPRTARIHLGLGLALLMIGGALYFGSWRNLQTGAPMGFFATLEAALFPVSIFLLGTPYLLWITWRQRERLLGTLEEDPEVTPPFAHLEQRPGHVWLAYALAAAFLLLVVVCLSGERLIAARGGM